MKKSKGKWTVGKQLSTVVSDTKVRNTNFPTPPNPEESRDEEIGYYGGYLVCESIGNPGNAKLIAAAPEMFDTLKSIVDYWNAPQEGKKSMNDHMDHIFKLADIAIKKATE
jgi:nitrous oxide reductase accessory protein NosL